MPILPRECPEPWWSLRVSAAWRDSSLPGSVGAWQDLAGSWVDSTLEGSEQSRAVT